MVELRDYDQQIAFKLSKANGEGYEKAEYKYKSKMESNDIKHI